MLPWENFCKNKTVNINLIESSNHIRFVELSIVKYNANSGLYIATNINSNSRPAPGLCLPKRNMILC